MAKIVRQEPGEEPTFIPEEPPAEEVPDEPATEEDDTAEEVELHSIEVDESLWQTKAGRVATPSIYQADLKLAIESGKMRGIPVPEGVKPTAIVSELHKAAKQLGVKVQTRNKYEEKGIITFRHKVEPDPIPEHHTPEHHAGPGHDPSGEQY